MMPVQEKKSDNELYSLWWKTGYKYEFIYVQQSLPFLNIFIVTYRTWKEKMVIISNKIALYSSYVNLHNYTVHDLLFD